MTPVDRVFRDSGEAGTVQPRGHLAASVEHLGQRPTFQTTSPQVAQLVDELGVAERPRRRRRCSPGPIGAWGDQHTLFSQDRADRLDPTPCGALLVDEGDDYRWRGSSSLAKKIEAAFKISLASRRSEFSFFNRLISASTSLLGPGLAPASV
jgi:hypothetical protein